MTIPRRPLGFRRAGIFIASTLALPALADHKHQCRPATFPATGQMAPFPSDVNDGVIGNFVDVPDDGTVQAGAPLRYRDNRNGTITDLNTRLIWEKKSDDGGLHDKNNVYLWSATAIGGEPGAPAQTLWDWLDDINSENGSGFAGHDDWRIPNVRELQSIVDFGRAHPSVNPVFHRNCVPGIDAIHGSCTVSTQEIPGAFYLTSTTDAEGVNGVRSVSFSVGNTQTALKLDALPVRAVRGGCE